VLAPPFNPPRPPLSLQEALSHPYLWELHSRAREPVCMRAFDWTFEKDYPDEMPQPLLQHHMYHEMLALRADQGLLEATAPPTIMMPAPSRPGTGGGAGATPAGPEAVMGTSGVPATSALPAATISVGGMAVDGASSAPISQSTAPIGAGGTAGAFGLYSSASAPVTGAAPSM